MRRLRKCGLWLAMCASAAVVDRVAIVVGTKAITETELIEEVRLTQFLNGQPLDLGVAARRAAGDRLVDKNSFAMNRPWDSTRSRSPLQPTPCCKNSARRDSARRQTIRRARRVRDHRGPTERTASLATRRSALYRRALSDAARRTRVAGRSHKIGRSRGRPHGIVAEGSPLRSSIEFKKEAFQ